jgi:acetyl-CoA synthetase/medium-chain acyl-CoA synthetase
MQDYNKAYREFTPYAPKEFSFPVDIFDKWGERIALLWTDGSTGEKFSFNELHLSAMGLGSYLSRHIVKNIITIFIEVELLRR